MKKNILLAVLFCCSFISSDGLAAPTKNKQGQLYFLSTTQLQGSLSELNKTEIATVNIQLNNNSTNDLSIGESVKLALPSGEIITGIVRRTLVGTDTSRLSNTKRMN
jgi:type IV secretory pathway VirB9-like protein